MQGGVAEKQRLLAACASHLDAGAFAYVAQVRTLVALADAYGADDHRDLLLGLAGSGRMGQARALGLVERARRLQEVFPQALELLEQGRLFVHTVEWMLRATKNASERAQQVLGQRLPVLLAGLDAADVHAVLHRTIAEVEEQVAEQEQQERHARAKANRGVWVKDVEDGMSRVGAEVDALSARRFALDLDTIVQAEKTRDSRDGVSRTAAQRRADVLMDLPARYLALVKAIAEGRASGLVEAAQARNSTGETAGPAAQDELPLGLPARCRVAQHAMDPSELLVELLRQPVPSRTVLNVHVPMGSALGLDSAPALVEGGGYLAAWLARLMLPDTALRRIVVDGATGIPVYVDLTVHTDHLSPPHPPPGPGRGRPPRGPSGGSTGPVSSPRRSRTDTTEHSDVRASLPTSPTTSPTGTGTGTATELDAAKPDGAKLGDAELEAHEAQVQPQRRALTALLGLLEPVVVPDTTEPGRFPSTALRRQVEVRDQRCTGPGCRRQARLCDLDHETDHHDGGPTSEPNLSAKSPRCHHAKHDGWTVQRDPQTGVSTWTSPLGQTYTRLPAWIRHRQHACVVSISPRDLRLPHVDTDYPDDRPLWRPQHPAAEAPAPAVPAAPAVPPALPQWEAARGWGTPTF